MAIVTLTGTNLGADVGPFNIYHTAEDAGNLLASNILRATLLQGWETDQIYDVYIVRSTGVCTNATVVNLSIPTATPTPTPTGATPTPTAATPTPTPTATAAGPTPTPTPTPTAQQFTTIYSDSQPGSGDLGHCQCEGTTQYEYQVQGAVNINADMTGDVVYENYGTSTLFVGDDKWYCIATSNGVSANISIQINNSGIVTGWFDCTGITPTPTATPTPTTNPNDCLEYDLFCPLGASGGSCTWTYDCCGGTTQEITIPEDNNFTICVAPGGSVNRTSVSGTATNTLQACTEECPTPTPTATPTATPTPTPTTQVYSFNTAYDANSELTACGIAVPDDIVYSSDGVIVQGSSVLYYNSNLTGQVANGYYHDTDNNVYYYVEGGGLVNEVGSCTTPTPTAAPTATPVPCQNVFMQEIGVSTSGGACLSASNTNRTFIGVGSYPALNDTIYAGQGCSTPFAGGSLWYNIQGDTSAVQINNSGVVIDKLFC